MPTKAIEGFLVTPMVSISSKVAVSGARRPRWAPETASKQLQLDGALVLEHVGQRADAQWQLPGHPILHQRRAVPAGNGCQVNAEVLGNRQP